MTATKPASSRFAAVRDFFKNYGRWILLCFGIAAVFYLVREAGADKVIEVISQAGPYLPIIVLLEISWVSMDIWALRILYGEDAKKVPFLDWIRSATVAYGVMILLPAGRAGGEVMRAAMLNKHVGMRSVAGAAQLQGATLLGNTLISIPCYWAVASMQGWSHKLALLVAANGIATGSLGLGILFITSRSRLGGWLGERLSFMKQFAADLDDALAPASALPKRAIFCTFVGRVLQTVQYGVILLAIGGQLTVMSGLIAQGIHLVGASLGDIVPNAVGITEGFYKLFAGTLGLESDPARAISIALVARLVQLSLAGIVFIFGGIRKAKAETHSQGEG